MRTPALPELLIEADADLRAALKAIDRNGQGVVFVCDSDRHLIGVLTDGDARRALVGGVELSAPLAEVMNREPVWCPATIDPEELVAKLGRERAKGHFSHIPLLDEERRIVDYASIYALRHIAVASPDLSGNELAYVADCVKTGWISSQGQYVREFERMMGDLCGVPHSLAVSNGTVALHLALVALGIGPGDEVIVPDFTFAASINVVCHAGATPVIVDVNPHTWTLDVDATAAALTPRTRAIMPVHLYGQPCDMAPLCELARKHSLRIVEDCAEALGSRYQGTHVGSFGDAAAFSFFGNKTITTGEGGMVLFRDAEVAARAKSLRDHGMAPQRRYWHEEVGFNYRMTNLQGAIGVAQMERIEHFLERKRRLSARYDEALAGLPGVELRAPVSWADTVCWLYTFLVTSDAGMTRDEIITRLQLSSIESRPVFYPLHEMPPYRPFTGHRSFPVSTDISLRGLSLPSAVSLTDEDIDAVLRALHGIISLRRLLPGGSVSSKLA